MKKFFKVIWSKIQYAFDWMLHHDYMSHWIGRTPFTLIGQKWDLHLFDEDPFPSVPHLHGVEDYRFKINVYTGDVYFKNILNAKLKEKEWKKIWECDKIYKDIISAREAYRQKHPHYQFPNIPNFHGDCNETDLEISYNGTKIEIKQL